LEPSFRTLKEGNTKAASLTYEELYRMSYNAVLRKQGHLLYDAVIDFERKWLSENTHPNLLRFVTPILASSVVQREAGSTTTGAISQRRQEGEDFLREMHQTWEKHLQYLNLQTDVLMYLVSTHSHRISSSSNAAFNPSHDAFKEDAERF
jgi:cullin 3